jgi:hypothetical protein
MSFIWLVNCAATNVTFVKFPCLITLKASLNLTFEHGVANNMN